MKKKYEIEQVLKTLEKRFEVDKVLLTTDLTKFSKDLELLISSEIPKFKQQLEKNSLDFL